MPPRRSRLDFPKLVMDKGFTSTPNLLDDLGLDPYHYRVLVFIIRWKGKATVERPLIGISLKYISEKTGISISKVKECIHDLEHEFLLIAVHRRKRLRNLYDIRPLFTALLKRQAGSKNEQPADRNVQDLPAGPDDQNAHAGAAAAAAAAIDLDGEPERQEDPNQPQFEEPVWDQGDVPDHDPEDLEEEAYAVRRSGFGTPSHAPDSRIYPGMDEDDPTHEERRQEEEVREACERGDHIPGKTAVIVFGDRREVIPIEMMRAAVGLGAFVLQS